MKIAYLPQPDKVSPEYLHFTYFRNAAAALGHEAVLCLSPDDINREAPDFVFASHAPNPKQTDYLQIGMMQCPVDFVYQWPEALNGMMSWDGLVTTAPSTRQWIEVVLQHRAMDEGQSAVPEVGHFFVTCDEQPYTETYAPDKLIYAGIGWDDRGIDLMRIVGAELGDRFEIYGGEKFWGRHNLPNYRGFLDTTEELCACYRSAVCLSVSNPLYLMADVMTTRMHEASSLGIATITPDSATTRDMYGDSLYYYNGLQDVHLQAREIIDGFHKVLADSARDIKRRQAYDLFNRHHSLRAQLPSLIDYAVYLKDFYRQYPRPKAV